MTAITYIKVNGQTVASEQFEGKNEKKVSRDASHWLCNMEFNVRSVLQAGGVQNAIITIGSDNQVIRHNWIACQNEDGKFGIMLAGELIEVA